MRIRRSTTNHVPGAGQRRLLLAATLACAAALSFAAPAAQASPVATDDASYAALGSVFPDPLANCQVVGASPCSPNARGNTPALQFIQIEEFLDALEFMNGRSPWSRYMEVLPLDGKIGPGSGDTPGDDMFPGNNLPTLEWDPDESFQSAGLGQSDLSRKKSDVIVLRVTDENVPDEGKERYALSLSIHGIERAGLEGGTRAAEDLITAATTGRQNDPIIPASIDPNAPSFADVLDEAIIYFTYPNPDGWRRGSVTEGGLFFQRYNGNGVDLNRDWPDIGYAFRDYSALSEPESRALASFFGDVRETTGSDFAAGDDLHGQPFADALSYTLLPHGRHDFAKNERVREAAITIHRNSEQALLWSPIVQPNDAPMGGGVPCAPTVAVGDACSKIYGQTWGTVYDTINYTTTGALGDWFDSTVGLNADGIDNEMSFSHLDKNIIFDPHTEQLHVDGNKGLIYAHLAEILKDRAKPDFGAPGLKGYVPNTRVTRDEKVYQEGPPANTVAQTDIAGQTGVANEDLEVVFPFEVERTTPAPGVPGIYNGGMRVDVRTLSAGGVATGTAHLSIQCKGCDDHPGVEDSDEWVTVGEDYNQSEIYLQAGVTVAVNRPQPFQADGSPVEWRAVLSGSALGLSTPGPSPVATMDIDFSRGPATGDGETGGGNAPRLAAYDVANTDYFADLNEFSASGEKFHGVDPAAVIDGSQSLDALDSIVLADEALPGYTGPYGDPNAGPTGPPTADFTFSGGTGTIPGPADRAPGTYETFPFTIGPNDGNSEIKVRVEWDQGGNDYDLYLYLIEDNDDRTLVQSATTDNSAAGGNGRFFEQVVVADPAAGDYEIVLENWLAPQSPAVDGMVTFQPLGGGGGGGSTGGTGAYTVAEKDDWMSALADWVTDGGNLVLTDGALRGLPDLTSMVADDIGRQTVYAGQVAFSTESGDTLADPLASDPLTIEQEGARFQTDFRRQTFEPTPLGFSIQNPVTGSDESNARQFDIDIDAFEAAGGRVAGTSADAGTRAADAVHNRVTVGEIPIGSGQIRVAGALLPQPTASFDHPLGLEPYATTYTGYILMRNLLEVEARDHECDPAYENCEDECDPEVENCEPTCEDGEHEDEDKAGKKDKGKGNEPEGVDEEVDEEEDDDCTNTGSSKTGTSTNTGTKNTGTKNTGTKNTGTKNTGTKNTGTKNTGSKAAGATALGGL